MRKIFNLQVPVDLQVKEKALNEAKRQGFSSLQEIARVLLVKLANKEISINFIPEYVEYLSDEEEERLCEIHDELIEDVKAGKASIARDGTDLINQIKKKKK